MHTGRIGFRTFLVCRVNVASPCVSQQERQRVLDLVGLAVDAWHLKPTPAPSSRLAIVASCIEALAVSFNLKELNTIARISPPGSHRQYLARLMKSLLIKNDDLNPVLQ